MIGWQFFKFIPQKEGKSIFEQLLELFKEILLYTSGDVNEALSWLTEIDKKYKITNDTYGMGDFINDLREKGFIGKGSGRDAGYIPTSKMELALRRQALDQIFDQIKKGKQGNHTSRVTGRGDEFTPGNTVTCGSSTYLPNGGLRVRQHTAWCRSVRPESGRQHL